jgi:hypothetical protein
MHKGQNSTSTHQHTHTSTLISTSTHPPHPTKKGKKILRKRQSSLVAQKKALGWTHAGPYSMAGARPVHGSVTGVATANRKLTDAYLVFSLIEGEKKNQKIKNQKIKTGKVFFFAPKIIQIYPK